MFPLTEPSSNVVPFAPANQPAEQLNFAQARDAWLNRWYAEPLLTHADRALVTQIYLHFNRKHFEKTGELLAWPGWETIATRARLSETSIYRGLKRLEGLGALEIIHGGRNPRTGWKLPNKYLAFLPAPLPGEHGSKSPPFRVNGGHLSTSTFQDISRLDNGKPIDSTDSSTSTSTVEDDVIMGLPSEATPRREEVSPEGPASDSPSAPPSNPYEDVPPGLPLGWGAPPPDRGGGRYVGRDYPEMALVERYELAIRRKLPRGQCGGCYVGHRDWQKIEAMNGGGSL